MNCIKIFGLVIRSMAFNGAMILAITLSYAASESTPAPPSISNVNVARIDPPRAAESRLWIEPQTASHPMRLGFPHVPNTVLELRASDDFGSWATLGLFHDRLLPFADPDAAGSDRRFYRMWMRPRESGDDVKNQLVLFNDPFVYQSPFGGFSGSGARWAKFAIRVDSPNRVHFQDTRKYLFHYDFATARLDGFRGMTRQRFDAVTLHHAGRELILGAVLMPGYGGPNEFGIQLVGHDEYSVEEVIALYRLVGSALAPEDPIEPRGFYFPTFEQSASANANRAALADAGIHLGSTIQWQAGDVCYAEGWAAGRLQFVTADRIDEAFADGTLRPDDILLTDGVPAEIPFVAGIISLAPSSPNSHVAILARSFGVPFVHLISDADRAAAMAMVGQVIGLRADPRFGFCEVSFFEMNLDPALMDEILELKRPPELEISPKETLGSLHRDTVELRGEDIRFFGGKAANFGLLRRTIPEHSPDAVAISFDLWDGFMDQTMPGGQTLRATIEGRLSKYTAYPPADIRALRSDLEAVRALIQSNTLFTPSQEETVIAALSRFDPDRKIRFRSSTNVEDTGQFTGAGLYDSFSGCLADDLDGDDEGPSRCDPDQGSERGVFRAIRKVYASFYNENAFLERLRHRVPEADVGMALLVHHSFPDEFELANGVATVDRGPFNLNAELVTQLGAVSVSNPDSSAQPEQVAVSKFGTNLALDLIESSSLVQLGAFVMDWQSDYRELSNLLFELTAAYGVEHPGRESYLLDFEFKKMDPGNLVVKQVREIPRPSQNVDGARYLVHHPNQFCVFQGEFGDVFANHRLKSLWTFGVRNTPISPDSLADPVYLDVEFEHIFDGETTTWEGSPTSWPNSMHGVNGTQFFDRWREGSGAARRDYELETTLPETSRNPLVILDDAMVHLKATHATPQTSVDFTGEFSTTTVDTVRLVPCPAPDERSIRVDRVAGDPGGVTIRTSFYWPPEPAGVVAGYTAPLVAWIETRISGLTERPIILHDEYSQTYRPGHHNFSEEFVFEPRLSPDLDEAILSELAAQDIHLLYLHLGGIDPRIFVQGADGKMRPLR